MAFTNPQFSIAQLKLIEGMSVADFGTGPGVLSIESAKKVGNSGSVYAIDIQKDMLKTVESNAKEAGVSNIKTIWADIEEPSGTGLKDECVDAVTISNLLFQSDNKGAVLDEAIRITKEDGKILIVDWTDSFGGLGPQPENVFPERDARRLATRKGVEIKERFNAGDHHYGLILIKRKEE